MNSVITWPGAQTRFIARDYEDVTVGAVAVPLTAALAAQAFRAVLKVDGGATIRYRLDGVAPTASVGYIAYDGEQVELSHDDAMTFQAIRVGGTNATLRVIYYRP